MLNSLFSLIGKSISSGSGGGVTPAATQFVYATIQNPAAGTVLSVTDTSRYENDYAGQPFLMPYSTTVYADGSGGSYPTEVWGLQYQPAGWTTAIGYRNVTVSVEGNDYVGGQDYFYFIEDGTGINYEGATVGSEWREPNGTNIGQWGDYQYFHDGNGGYYYNYNPPYPTYGTYLGSGGGDYTYTTPSCGTFITGTYSYTNYADGNGGSYSDSSSSYYSYGTFLSDCNGYNYYADGSGGAYSIAAYGTVLSNDSGSSDLNWSAPDGATGTWAYYSWGSTTYSDGYGGSYTYGGGSYQQYATTIYSGSYSYENGTDEYGNPQYSTQNFQLNYDGNGGYYTNSY